MQWEALASCLTTHSERGNTLLPIEMKFDKAEEMVQLNLLPIFSQLQDYCEFSLSGIILWMLTTAEACRKHLYMKIRIRMRARQHRIWRKRKEKFFAWNVLLGYLHWWSSVPFLVAMLLEAMPSFHFFFSLKRINCHKFYLFNGRTQQPKCGFER